ncbi:gastrokine-1-like isoform X1 [Hyperolius riggenbachi]|uniref:gastrokine-1-like isoform X1 n=1 Tax=Hyperolius riggenbachi TaxID=752182 RepID=UPI0035A2EDE4
MKFLIAAVFGVLLTVSLATDNVDISNSGNDSGSVNQQVNINNQDNIANINHFNGWNSWDSICDYARGFAVTRLYNMKVCVITKMKPDFPSMEHLKAVADKQQAPTTQMTTYTVNKTPILNIGEYSHQAEALCRGMPAYIGQEMPEFGAEFALCHSNSIITILGISFCF